MQSTCSMCNDRLRQPCRQRLQLRREARRRGTVAAILSRSVMHPSCMHLSQPQTHLVIRIVSCRHLLSVLVCTCASVRVCVCVVEKCVRVCFGAAFPSCVCRWIRWIENGLRQPCRRSISRQAGSPRGTVAAIFPCTACVQPACCVLHSCTWFMG